MSELHLVMAALAEHRARTSHDVSRVDKDMRGMLGLKCEVCLWLREAWEEIERARQECCGTREGK